MFTVIVTVVFADIGGYVAGVLFGKHPMVPAISPKKSWEGLGGSLLFGIRTSYRVLRPVTPSPEDQRPALGGHQGREVGRRW